MIPVPPGYEQRVEQCRQETAQRLVRHVVQSAGGRMPIVTTIDTYEVRSITSVDADHYGPGAGGAPFGAATQSTLHISYRVHTVTTGGFGVHQESWEERDAPPTDMVTATFRLWRGDPARTRAAADSWDQVADTLRRAWEAVDRARQAAAIDWQGTNGAKFQAKCDRELATLTGLREAAMAQANALHELAELQQQVDEAIQRLIRDLAMELIVTAGLALLTAGLDVAVGAAVAAAETLETSATVARLVERMFDLLVTARRVWIRVSAAHPILVRGGIEATAKIATGLATGAPLDPVAMGASAAGSFVAAGLPEAKILAVFEKLLGNKAAAELATEVVLGYVGDGGDLALAAATGDDTDLATVLVVDTVLAAPGSKVAANLEDRLRADLRKKYRLDVARERAALGAKPGRPFGRLQDYRRVAVDQRAGELAGLVMGGATTLASRGGSDGVEAATELAGAATARPVDGSVALLDSLDAAAMSDALPAAPAHQLPAYTVQPGDSVASIATRVFGTPDAAARIVAANPGLDPNRIYPGDRLTMP